jgi:hypothetical protein
MIDKETQIHHIEQQIAKLEINIDDIKYFIDTAPCLETRKIYQKTLAEHAKELYRLTKVKNSLIGN